MGFILNRKFLLFFIPIAFLSCQKLGTEPKENPEMYNPSELSLLMNEMHAALLKIKQDSFSTHFLKDLPPAEKMLASTATKNENKDQEFQAMAKSYILAYNNLKNSSADSLKTHFKAVVNNCYNCHSYYCQLAQARIETLELPKK